MPVGWMPIAPTMTILTERRSPLWRHPLSPLGSASLIYGRRLERLGPDQKERAGPRTTLSPSAARRFGRMTATIQPLLEGDCHGVSHGLASGLHRPGPPNVTPLPTCRARRCRRHRLAAGHSAPGRRPGPWRPSRASRRGSNDGSRVIRVGLSWGRILEPRELGLRGFRTLPPPSTGDPSRAQPVDRPRPDRTRPLASDTGPAPAPSTRRADRVNKLRGHGHGA